MKILNKENIDLREKKMKSFRALSQDQIKQKDY